VIQWLYQAHSRKIGLKYDDPANPIIHKQAVAQAVITFTNLNISIENVFFRKF
jgi:hypothetical protein